MEFRTELKLSKSIVSIDHQSRILMIGSCFSDNIGGLLQTAGMEININPFGTVFNSNSINKQIANLVGKDQFSNEFLDKNLAENFAFHYDVHTTFNDREPDLVMQNIKKAISDFKFRDKPLTHCFISLGTSWVYEHIALQKIVANCHKMPQQIFTKKLLSVEENTHLLHNIVENLTAAHPEIKVIFTVSPVRHIKDGIIENARSKAILIESVHRLQQQNVSYFPAYELMMDDLRDYRFYGKDLIHPSDMGINYIWEKFVATFFIEQTLSIARKFEKLAIMKNHRVIGNDPLTLEKHRSNLEKLELEIKSLLG